MSFQSVMQTIEKDAKIAFTDIEALLPSEEALVEAIYPPSVPIITAVNVANGLVVKTVAAVEQKWQLAGQGAKTGLQKSADVIAQVGPAVLQILAAEGVTVDNTYVQRVIDAAVATLNIPILTKQVVTSSAPALTSTTSAAASVITGVINATPTVSLQPAPVNPTVPANSNVATTETGNVLVSR